MNSFGNESIDLEDLVGVDEVFFFCFWGMLMGWKCLGRLSRSWRRMVYLMDDDNEILLRKWWGW